MKSKISFFNRKLMMKNAKLYWPIWSVYFAVQLLAGPLNLWVTLSRDRRLGCGFTDSEILFNISTILEFDVLIIGMAFMSVLTAMALFNYLYSSRSANMMHAFPLTRSELFGTNLISGLTFMIAPMVVCFLLNVFICLGFGVVAVEFFGIWLLVGIAVTFIMYGLAVFCAMLTGQLFALPVYYLIVHLFYYGMRVIMRYTICYLGFGIADYDIMNLNSSKLSFLTPIYRLCADLKFRRHMVYDPSLDYYVCDGMTFHGGWTAAIYGLVGIVFMVIAFVIYRKRNVEQAGDLITVSFLKPVFRWGLGLCGGVCFAYMAGSFLSMVTDDNSPLLFAIVLLIGGAACFCIAEMLLRKNFRIGDKTLCREAFAFLCFTLVFFFGMNTLADRESRLIPNENDLTYAHIYNSYPLNTDHSPDAKADIIAMHKEIIAYLDTHDKKDFGEYGTTIDISYNLKNGRHVRRSYVIPFRDESVEILSKVSELENKPEYYIDHLFYPMQDDVSHFSEGELATYDENWDNYKSHAIGEDAAPIIAAAVQQDIREGNLQKYNNMDAKSGFEAVEGAFAANLYLSGFRRESASHEDFYDDSFSMFSTSVYDNYVTEEASAFIGFGKDCKHTIQALIEQGIIESEDELSTVIPGEGYIRG